MDKETLKLFCQVFFSLARSEKKAEIIKEMLCQLHSFEPYTVFKHLAVSSPSHLTSRDLSLFLQRNRLIHTEEAIESNFMRIFDRDLDGLMDYSEFLQLVLPADQPLLRAMVAQREPYYCENIDEEIEYTLARLIEAEIESFKTLREIDFPEEVGILLEELFHYIDCENTGFIDFENLYDFFKSLGFFPYEEEVIYILRRVDRSNDGRLEKSDLEVLFAVTPGQTYRQSRYQSKRNQSQKYTYYPYQPIRQGFSPMKETTGQRSKTLNYKDCNGFELGKKEGRLWSKTLRMEPNFKENFFETNNKLERNEQQNSKTLQYGQNSKENDIKRPLSLRDKQNYKENDSTQPIQYSKTIGYQSNYKEHETKRSLFSSKTSGYASNLNEETGIEGRGRTTLKALRAKYSQNKENCFEKKEKNEVLPEKTTKKLGKNQENPILPLEFEVSRGEGLKKGTESTKELCDFFNFVINCETKLEGLKKELSLRPDFNLVDLFTFFDKERKGYCNVGNFEAVMNELNLKWKSKDLSRLFERFDLSGRNFLRFSDFCDVFCPFSKETFQILNQRKPINTEEKFRMKELFSPETLRIIGKVILFHMQNEKEQASIRNLIFKGDSSSFFPKNSFTKPQVRDLMQKNGIMIDEEGLDLLIERLDPHN